LIRGSNTPFFVALSKKIGELGGLFNAHMHLDRTGTFGATLRLFQVGEDGVSHLSLSKKNALIPLVHASDCYEPKLLRERVKGYVEMMIKIGTTRADTLVDVTDDCVGRRALDEFIRVKESCRGLIDLRIGAYSPLGFRDDEPRRWALIEEGAAAADFIGALPERDNQLEYPEHIGFRESCRRILSLSDRLGKHVHIHVDQNNREDENGAECVLELVRERGLVMLRGSEPRIWLVHVISPSAYDEDRFAKMLRGLAELHIGVICCPSAAISMRQLRPLTAPTHNSIARVLEMLAADVRVRLGTDNVCDITSPGGTIDLMDEIFLLSNTVRFYDLDILAKLGAGRPLEARDCARITAHLTQDRLEVTRALAKCDWVKASSAVER
jgi:cytosine deaminase